MSIRNLALVFACAVLSGCNQISAGLTPADDRINSAFPLQDTVKIAYSALVSSLDGKPVELKTATEQYAKLMSVRALTCTAKSSIGRFDTVANIRGKVVDTDCFQKQDARLAEWISLQRLSFALNKPALLPLSVLPAKVLLPSFTDYSGQVTVAAQANVMVIKGAQRFTAVQIPGGKVISSFPVPEQTYRPAMLAANGQVLAVPVGSRNLRMIEVGTGNVLWTTEEYSDLIAWFPQVQAALLTQTGTGSPQLLDIKNGKIDAFPATEKRLTWAQPMKTASGKYLVGAGQTVSEMDITRTAQGTLEVAPLQQWRLNGNGISSANAFLMSDGTKLVYQSGQDLAWLNLENQQQGVWQLSAINAYGFAKLGEKSILFDAQASGANAAATRLLDTDEGTVAIAKNVDLRDGSLVSLSPRSGYLRRSDSSVTMGTSVEVDTPQQLDRLVSDALLAKQLAKIAAMDAGNRNESSSMPNPYHEALAKQVRAMNVAAAIRDGLPRDVVESMRRGSSDYGRNQGKTVTPLLTDVPSNARISVVGVYEGTSSATGSTAVRRPGSVRINVQRGSEPLVLVLANYEPVHWLINTNGRKISKILTSGYHDATVIGAQNTTVIKIGSQYAYKIDSNEYSTLKRDVARYVANPVQLFQGAYTGREFSVN